MAYQISEKLGKTAGSAIESLSDLGCKVIEKTVKGSKTVLGFFNELLQNAFKSIEEKGVAASLMGAINGILSLIIKPKKNEETSQSRDELRSEVGPAPTKPEKKPEPKLKPTPSQPPNKPTDQKTEQKPTLTQADTDKMSKLTPVYKPSDSNNNLVLNETESVVSQIIAKLNPNQKRNAQIIEEEFTKAGVAKPIIAAAIINAKYESGLRAGIQSTCRSKSGKQEDSWGLFQINIPARFKGNEAAMNAFREKMKDPRENCKEMLRTINSRWGDRLKSAAASGASVPRLAAIFCRDIERPHNAEKSMEKRAALTRRFFKLDGSEQLVATYIKSNGVTANS